MSAAATVSAPVARFQPIQFSVERGVLLRALAHVQTVVERRGTIPVLSHVKLEARADGLSLTATDMDIALVERVSATVGEAGGVTVPAHTLYDIVRKLPDGALVEMSSKGEGKVSIAAGASRFTLGSLPVEEFPVMADGDLAHNFRLSAAECRALMQKPAYAMSTEETRYYLNGICLHLGTSGEAPVLRAVATDGHRLARVEVARPVGADALPSVIVPRKTIHEVRKLLEDGEGEVQISLSETKIRVVYGQAVLVSKLIDGTFPDYERVIPAANDKLMEVDRQLFVSAVDRVSIISSERSRGIRLAMEKGKLTLSATNAESGTATEEMDMTYGADPLEMGFNARYLMEMTSQIEGDVVQFLFSDPASPVLVRDTGDVSALYVIMPMRV